MFQFCSSLILPANMAPGRQARAGKMAEFWWQDVPSQLRGMPNESLT
jgi:uncharacterized membrane protein